MTPPPRPTSATETTTASDRAVASVARPDCVVCGSRLPLLPVANTLDGRAMIVVHLGTGKSPGNIDCRGAVFACPEGFHIDPKGCAVRTYYLGGDTVSDMIFEDHAESTVTKGVLQDIRRSLNALAGVGEGVVPSAGP